MDSFKNTSQSGSHVRRFFPICFVGEQQLTSCVLGDQLNGSLRQGRRQRNSDRADPHRTEQDEYPVGDVFHEDTDMVAAPDAFGKEAGRDLLRIFENVRVSVMFYLVFA